MSLKTDLAEWLESLDTSWRYLERSIENGTFEKEDVVGRIRNFRARERSLLAEFAMKYGIANDFQDLDTSTTGVVPLVIANIIERLADKSARVESGEEQA